VGGGASRSCRNSQEGASRRQLQRVRGPASARAPLLVAMEVVEATAEAEACDGAGEDFPSWAPCRRPHAPS
jgi:hypothetical protein